MFENILNQSATKLLQDDIEKKNVFQIPFCFQVLHPLENFPVLWKLQEFFHAQIPVNGTALA